MARIDLSALNEQERARALRQMERDEKRAHARPTRQLPPLVYVLLIAAGFGALFALDLVPWGAVCGGTCIAAGAYGLGMGGAPVGREARSDARVDRLSDTLGVVAIRLASTVGRTSPAPAPAPRGKVRRNARFPRSRRPNLRAIAGGAPGSTVAALDRPLSGEGDDDTEGTVG